MTFNKQLLHNIVFRGVYYTTIFLLNIVIARSYEAEQSGWINFISNNFALVLLFGSLSLDISILYFGASKKIDTSKLAFFAMLWSIFVCVAFYFTVSFFISKSQFILSKGLLKFAAVNYFGGIIVTNFFFNLFIIKEEFLIPNILLSIINLMLIIFIPDILFHCTLFDKETYLYYYYLSFSLQGLILVIAYFVYAKKLVMKLPNWIELKALFKYASIAFVANLVFFMVYRIDYWFIHSYRSSAAELGNYIQASKLGQMLLVFSMIISSTVFPQTASGQTIVVIEKLLKIIRNFLVLFALLLLSLLLVGQHIMTFVFGHTFNQMYWPFIYLLPGIFSLSVLTIISAYFGGINKTFVNVKSALVGLVLITILDILFIPKYGIIAAAIVSSVGYFFAMLYAIYCFQKEHPFSAHHLLVIKKTDFAWFTKAYKTALRK